MTQVLAENRKAGFDYFIEDQLEAGMVLEGWEAKAFREGHANLEGAFVTLSNGEAYLTYAHVSPGSSAQGFTLPDATRPRKLLLHRHQLSRLVGKVAQKGFSLIPLKATLVRGKVKLEVGVCKGKKLHDKRNTLKNRELDREVAREVTRS